MFEADAGWLPVEKCVRTHLDAAVEAGAEHRWGEPVVNWRSDADGVCVETDTGSYQADSLVITGGPWAQNLLADLSLPLQVVRKHLHWFRCDDERYRNGFFFELPDRLIYGFPAGNGRLKLAEHSGGEPVADPLEKSEQPCPIDSERVEQFVAECMPGVTTERVDHKTCFYTMTPDEHFILDKHPNLASVAFAAGFSGHGFKFASAVGEALVDMATGRTTCTDLSFLSAKRFSA